MYRIIGADGKEYGPVSAEIVRQWLAQGRANAQSRIRPEEAADWKFISELPEFVADLAARGHDVCVLARGQARGGCSATITGARCLAAFRSQGARMRSLVPTSGPSTALPEVL